MKTKEIFKKHQTILNNVKEKYYKNTDRELEYNFASLIAWDIIINEIAKTPQQKKTMWNGIYNGWLNEYKPDNETEFKNWFNCTLAVARAKKVSTF